MNTEGQLNISDHHNEKQNINISIVCPIQELDSELGTSFNSTTTSNIPELFGDEDEEWLAGRSSHHYPKDENLPWHTCFIDDGMIGGCSAPVKRYHWKAMRDAGVGLVVNLTERPIFPNEKAQASCLNCDFFEEVYDYDIFDDLDDADIEVLVLPVQDGSIPRWEQLDIFQKEAAYTISRGKKVLVHCQAGVGRTGTFLAVYLMEKYQCTASEAIKKLRFIRPQSLQFDKYDWQKYPFKFSAQESYSRNFIQERFIEVYHEARICKKRFKAISELMEGVTSSVEETLGQSLVAVVDGELEARLNLFEENVAKTYFEDIGMGCFACKSILYVGPELVKRGLKQWPSLQ